MKPPKEPKTFKYPRIYMCELAWSGNTRMRIIYPDGRAEWFHQYAGYDMYTRPCWQAPGLSATEQVKRMKKYDRDEGNKPYYVGEIR